MSLSPFPAMIFAAGYGTRMRPLTEHVPKPLIEVAGKPLIDHARDRLAEAGIAKVVSNLHYLPQALEAHLADSNVHTIRETPDILDTGGGLRNALPFLGTGPVITINPDAIWAGPNPVSLALEQWNAEKMDALLVCVSPENARGTDSAGDFSVSPTGVVGRGPGIVYGGVQILKTDGLQHIPEKSFSLNVLWDRMMSDGRLATVTYPGLWCDVGHPDGIPTAESLLGFHA